MREEANDMEDLAPWLRDWSFEECEHYTGYRNDPTCCAPCLRDRILASEWLKEHDAKVETKARRDALFEVDQKLRESRATFAGIETAFGIIGDVYRARHETASES